MSTIATVLGGIALAIAGFFGAEPNLGAQPPLTTAQGGTGSTSPSGIIYGDSSLRLKTVTIGNNLTFSGGTLSASGGGSTFPFTPTTNFGAVTNATSTPVWFRQGLQASSTANLATTTLGLNTRLSLSSAMDAQDGENASLVLQYRNDINTSAKANIAFESATSTKAWIAAHDWLDASTYHGHLSFETKNLSDDELHTRLAISHSCDVCEVEVTGANFRLENDRYLQIGTDSDGLKFTHDTALARFVASSSLPWQIASTTGIKIGGVGAPAALLHVERQADSLGAKLDSQLGTANTAALLLLESGAAGGIGLASLVQGDSVNRFSMNTSGAMQWGAGAATRDVGISRGAAGQLNIGNGTSGSTAARLSVDYASTTATTNSGTASTSALVLSNSINIFGGGAKTTANDLCVQLTGSADLCDGNDGGGSGTGLSTSSPVAAGNVLAYSGTGAGSAFGVATTTITYSGFPASIPATYGTQVGGANTTFTWWGLATSSAITQSHLLYSSGGAGVTSVATTTLTGNNGLSLSAGAGALVGGSNATIGLASINAGVLGAVTSAVPTSQATSTLYGASSGGMVLGWNNNTGGIGWIATSSVAGGVSSVTGTFPIISSGGATPNITFGGLSTSSPIAAASGLLYATGVNTLASVSTSSAITMSITGNAGTATALAGNGANCAAGLFPLGVDASGVSESCTYAFATTTPWSAGVLALSNAGLGYSVASSSIFGYTPLNPTRQLTIAGTAGQITSSAGGQDLSADRTWTLSLPSHVILPSSFQASQGSTTNATSTNLHVTGALSLFGNGSVATANALCVQLTGSADLCDGDDGGGGGSSKWTDGGLSTYLTATADDMHLGSTATATAPFWFDVSATTTYIGNGGAGDSFSRYGPSGYEWILGFDDTDDSFAIASSTVLGTLNALTINKSTLYTTLTGLNLTNALTVANGGTGAASLTDHGVLVGSGTDAITALSVGTNGQLLIGSTGADPTFATLNCADGLTCTTGAGTLEIDFDGADSPQGELGGTWASPTIDDSLTVASWSLSGATLTGNIDAGGATFLEIPNGTAPTADDPGELAHDTSDNQLILDDFVVAKATQKIWSVTVASTSPAFISAGLLKVPTELDGYTVTAIRCSVQSGTSKVVAVEDEAGNSSEDITCGTSVTSDDGSITNATYTAAEEAYIDFGATSGTVDYVSVSVFGTWTRE